MALVETAPSSSVIPGEVTIAQLKKLSPNRFFIRRLLADYSQPMFVGNEYAGFFLIIGSLLSWSLNPYHVSYGTGLFPGILLAGWLSGAMAIYLYWDRWMEQDFFPSFVGIVSAAPQLVLKFGSSIWIIVFTAVLAGSLSAHRRICEQQIAEALARYDWLHFFNGVGHSCHYAGFAVFANELPIFILRRELN